MEDTSSLSVSGLGAGSLGKESAGFLTAFFFGFISLRKGAVSSFFRPDSNLLGRYVHQFHLGRRNHRIVSILTSFYFIADKSTIVIQRSISLRNNLFFLFFSSQINQTVIRKIHFSIFYLTEGSFNES